MPNRGVDIPEAAARRAYLNYEVDKMTGCYVSNYSTASHGYAQVGWGSRKGERGGTTAHRAAWTYVNGQIPEGMTIDHLCKNRRCVRIEHLRMLSNFENARRTRGRDWPLGECVNGHPNSDLVQRPNGTWICHTCDLEGQRRHARTERGKATKAAWNLRNREKILGYKRAYYQRLKERGA